MVFILEYDFTYIDNMTNDFLTNSYENHLEQLLSRKKNPQMVRFLHNIKEFLSPLNIIKNSVQSIINALSKSNCCQWFLS